jgi:hypothetical protein
LCHPEQTVQEVLVTTSAGAALLLQNGSPLLGMNRNVRRFPSRSCRL